jgi:MarR family transcriptional regulator, organic hydroperoxide resistance regulator
MTKIISRQIISRQSSFLTLHGQTGKALRALVDAAIRPMGLHPGQDHVLAVLWANDGITPGGAAAVLKVTTPTVVKMADRMAAAGLLTRRRDKDDKRLVHLFLTDKGRALHLPVEAARKAIEKKVTAGLSETERRALMRALEKVLQAAEGLTPLPAR